MDKSNLRQMVFQTIIDLSTEDGINASGKEDVYGCVFGRDSAISILKILQAVKNTKAFSPSELQQLYDVCHKGLLTLVRLQGQKVNIESGEEPGKFIHEYRKDNYERLTKIDHPWYIYPENILKNYDSVDSTPLILIAIYRYYEITTDKAFLYSVLPAVEAGLNWIMQYGDRDQDFLLEYELSKYRAHGGLSVQSWTDSSESMTDKSGNFPIYPIAPAEVQGYAWLALKLWNNFYQSPKSLRFKNMEYARVLLNFSKKMKIAFNKKFILQDSGYYYVAQALDGNKNQIKTITGNPLLLLWATYRKLNRVECIIRDRYINSIIHRAFRPDMFDPVGGVRTMSTHAENYNSTQDSYHNGSFWPKLNGMAEEGLLAWGYKKEAEAIAAATLRAIEYFGSPIELYIRDSEGQLQEYENAHGQHGTKNQAWSAAAALAMLSQTKKDERHKKLNIQIYRTLEGMNRVLKDLPQRIVPHIHLHKQEA